MSDESTIRLIALTLARDIGITEESEIPEAIWERARRKVARHPDEPQGFQLPGTKSVVVDPIEETLRTWAQKGDIFYPGEPAPRHRGVKVFGGDERAERGFAKAVAMHVRENGTDHTKLVDFLINPATDTGTVKFRSNAIPIAETVNRILAEKGLA